MISMIDDAFPSFQALSLSFDAIKQRLSRDWKIKFISIKKSDGQSGALMRSELQEVKKSHYFYRIYVDMMKGQAFIFREVLLMLSLQSRFLTQLWLKECNITDKSLESVRQANWIFIRNAKFNNNYITSLGVKIITCCNWIYLQCLVLSGNVIKNKGVQWISKANWPYIQYLFLNNCSIDNNSIRALSKQILKRLIFLDLSNNIISIDCFKLVTRFDAYKLNNINITTYRPRSGETMLYPIHFAKAPKSFGKVRIMLSDSANIQFQLATLSFFAGVMNERYIRDVWSSQSQ